MSRPIIARPRRANPILVCKKCMKRCSGGAKIRRALKRDLKHRGSDAQKPPRLVSTSCFGICPKRSVVLTSGTTLTRGEYVLVSDRDDVDAAVALLTSP